MKKSKQFFAVLMMLALVLALIPTTAVAYVEEPGMVIVSVSNYTYDGAAETQKGEFVVEYVEMTPAMTTGEAIAAACVQAGVTVTGIEGGYITEIAGLAAGDGGAMSGWMLSTNNWFSNSFTPLSDPVENGDWVSLGYTMDWGTDLGSLFDPENGANDKRLQELYMDLGEMEPKFDPAIHEYTLTLPEGTESLFVMPVAFNLNYQVKTSVDGTVYKLMDGVPVADGTVITIVCGDPTWPSMNNGTYGTGAENIPGETYTITIAFADVTDDGGGDDVVEDNGEENNGGIDEEKEGAELTAEMDDSPETGDTSLASYAGMLMVIAAAGMTFVTRRRTDESERQS